MDMYLAGGIVMRRVLKEYDFDSIVMIMFTIYPKWLKMHTVTM